jgi:hypothetical protein
MWDQVKDALGQSASRVLTGVASVLPGVVAMLVAVLLAAPVGWLVRALLRRALHGVHFDERMEHLGFGMLAEMSPNRSPTALVVRIVYWGIIALGLLVGLAAIDPLQTTIVFHAIIAYLPNLVVAILLLVVGAVVARFAGRSVLIGAVNLQVRSARLLGVGVKWLVMVLAAAMALNHLRIGGEVLTLAFGILFGGIVLSMALAIGLGSKEMVQRSWERQEGDGGGREEHHEETMSAPLQHL